MTPGREADFQSGQYKPDLLWFDGTAGGSVISIDEIREYNPGVMDRKSLFALRAREAVSGL